MELCRSPLDWNCAGSPLDWRTVQGVRWIGELRRESAGLELGRESAELELCRSPLDWSCAGVRCVFEMGKGDWVRSMADSIGKNLMVAATKAFSFTQRGKHSAGHTITFFRGVLLLKRTQCS